MVRGGVLDEPCNRCLWHGGAAGPPMASGVQAWPTQGVGEVLLTIVDSLDNMGCKLGGQVCGTGGNVSAMSLMHCSGRSRTISACPAAGAEAGPVNHYAKTKLRSTTCMAYI